MSIVERVIRAKIKVLEERKEKIWVSGMGPEAIFREETLNVGYYLGSAK